MPNRSLLVPVLLGFTLQLHVSSASAQASPEDSPFRPVVDEYCTSCHDPIEYRGDLALDNVDLTDVASNAPILEKMVVKLRGQSMPPVGKPRPDNQTYGKFADWLESELDSYASAHPNPGRPALYRLNRTQYATVISDLLSLDIDVSALLPPDSTSYGFDNIADVLTVSPALLEGYLAAADKVSAIAVGDPDLPVEESVYGVGQRYSQDKHIEGLPPGTRGGFKFQHWFPLDGVYEFDTTFLKTSQDAVRGLEFPHQFELSVDGRRVKLISIGGTADYTLLLENAEASRQSVENRTHVRLPLTAGMHTVTATFVEKTEAYDVSQFQPYELSNFDPVYVGGIPSVQDVTIRGPYQGEAPLGASTASRKAIFTCQPSSPRNEKACAEQILSRLARRAYRRPVSDDDMDVLMKFFSEGRDAKGTFAGGIQMGLRRILASPDFIFRVERDPEAIVPGTAYHVSDLELASRLSFFLWSSIPDDQLIDLAAAGKLRQPKVLAAQVHRMLEDPRSKALVKDFAGQWLNLRRLNAIEPDIRTFPDFDDNLRDAFRTETSMFFESIMRENRSVMDLLTADYTFVNERLARHYGIPGVYGGEFRRVKVPIDARRGLLGQGSILTVTSLSHRTSPVVRGKWVLDNLMGMPPPPPPPNVPALKENSPDSLDQESMRERMERHRADPTCAACHNVMDPIGFSMEPFDAIGTYRQRDAGGNPIDASGQLASGQAIDGPAGLRDAIAAKPEIFVRTFTEKLLTYALGRGLEFYDMPTVRKIVDDARSDDYRFNDIVLGVINSTPFLMRQAADPQDTSADGGQLSAQAQTP